MRIMIVDDDSKVTDLLSKAAQARGYGDIDIAQSGDEAFSRAITGTYDLITLDIEMPGASGLEVLSPVRNLCPHAIIAIESGYIPEDFAASELGGCADVVIEKPIAIEAFFGLLDCAKQIKDAMQVLSTLGDTPTLAR